MKTLSDAWVDACTEFAICMVADKGLIQGMVSTRHRPMR